MPAIFLIREFFPSAATIRLAEIILLFSRNTFAENLSTFIFNTLEFILLTLPHFFRFFVVKSICLIKSEFSTTWPKLLILVEILFLT